MKTKSFQTIILLFILSVGTVDAVFAQSESKKVKSARKPKTEIIQLFNGKDLTNWVFKLKDPSFDPSKVFKIENGVLHITGLPFGYMRTKDSYADYNLHVEWRWSAGSGNSGVFVHTQVPDTTPLKVIEVQLAAGNAGDFMCGQGVSMNECSDKSKRTVKKMAPSSEKPAGEWNIMDVTCISNTIEVTVNGVLQNKGTNVSLSSGHICLQSEGKDIKFRNVTLTRQKRRGLKN
jgi:hypothetical protein